MRRVIVGPDDVVVANEDTVATIKPDGIDIESPDGPVTLTVTYDVTGDLSASVMSDYQHVGAELTSR